MGHLVCVCQTDTQHMGHILHGQHQREFIKRILFGFSHSVPFYLRPEGFYSLFCGPVFEPLTWSCQATVPPGRLACAPRPCASPTAFSAACGRSGFRRGGTLGRSCPGRSDSCGGATGSLPASQRADGFPPSGSEGTVHFAAENIVGELGLDLTDALFGEVGLSRLCGPGHHVDVRVLALVVKGGVPAEVTGRYLCGCVV